MTYIEPCPRAGTIGLEFAEAKPAHPAKAADRDVHHGSIPRPQQNAPTLPFHETDASRGIKTQSFVIKKQIQIPTQGLAPGLAPGPAPGLDPGPFTPQIWARVYLHRNGTRVYSQLDKGANPNSWTRVHSHPKSGPGSIHAGTGSRPNSQLATGASAGVRGGDSAGERGVQRVAYIHSARAA